MPAAMCPTPRVEALPTTDFTEFTAIFSRASAKVSGRYDASVGDKAARKEGKCACGNLA